MQYSDDPTPPQQMGGPDDLAGDEALGHHHDMVSHEQVKKTSKPKKVPELNIVPMLDVCFNLLIFFISTASFAMGEGVLPANMPVGQGQASQSSDAPEQPITIMLRSLGGNDIAIEIQGSAVSLGKDFNELFENLKRLQHNENNPNGIYSADDAVVIQPEGNVQWGYVVNAFNAAIRARYKKVNFAQMETK